MSNVAQFKSILRANGQDATFHRENAVVMVPCPCLTPEGYPDMEWHEDHPTVPMHNEQGRLSFWPDEFFYVPVGGYWSVWVEGDLTITQAQHNALLGLMHDLNFNILTPDIVSVEFTQDPRPAMTALGLTLPTSSGPLNPVLPSPASGVTEAIVKAFIQPIQSTRATRLSGEAIIAMFGEVQTDDHLGIFPLDWAGTVLNFYDWSQAGEDFIMYDGRRFLVVNANKISDPDGGDFHHWEVALRLMKTERPSLG